jgi:hypothetical protein
MQSCHSNKTPGLRTAHAIRVLLPALLLALAALEGHSAQPSAMPHVDEIPSSQSIFIDDPKFARDPFFPKSQRWKPKIVVAVNNTPDTGTQILNSFVLKGISGRPGKRLALLNNRTVGVGEISEFRSNNQIFKVRCVEIREKSVLLGVEGTSETKEIFLRSGF